MKQLFIYKVKSNAKNFECWESKFSLQQLSLKIIINQNMMIQIKENTSWTVNTFFPKKGEIKQGIVSNSSFRQQNLKIKSNEDNYERFKAKTLRQPNIGNVKLFLTTIKLVQSKINQQILLGYFSKIKQKFLKSQFKSSFSEAFTFPHLSLETQNPESEMLGLQSRCRDKNEEKENNNSPKNLQKKVFSLKLQNQKLKKQVSNLKQEIEENLKRQAKEVMKKKQSLEGLMEEIADKNEFIQELQATIRLLQSRLGANEKGMLQSLLQEDSQSLRKTITRLQSVNDKLNFDLEKIKKEKNFFQVQNKAIRQKYQQMQNQFKMLKQHIFDLEANHQIVEMMKQQINLAQKKYKSKVEKTKKLQKRLSQIIKCKDSILEIQSQIDFDTLSKKVDSESTASNLRRTSQLKSQISQSKLQSIFNFIFNISEEKYEFQCIYLFDEEQKQLMKIHKQIFIKNKKNHFNPNYKMELQDSPYYFDKSFHDVFNHTVIEKQVEIRDKKIIANLENECQKLISKICSLKEKEMHIRQVVMNVLKEFQLKPLRKQSEVMFNFLCQLFEYSEGERQLFSHPKSRKFFGFI